jgi:hypothetical protein
LSLTEFIHKVIYDRNGEFLLDGKFVEGMKTRSSEPSDFLLEGCDDMGRIGAGTGMDNTRD